MLTSKILRQKAPPNTDIKDALRQIFSAVSHSKNANTNTNNSSTQIPSPLNDAMMNYARERKLKTHLNTTEPPQLSADTKLFNSRSRVSPYSDNNIISNIRNNNNNNLESVLYVQENKGEKQGEVEGQDEAQGQDQGNVKVNANAGMPLLLAPSYVARHFPRVLTSAMSSPDNKRRYNKDRSLEHGQKQGKAPAPAVRCNVLFHKTGDFCLLKHDFLGLLPSYSAQQQQQQLQNGGSNFLQRKKLFDVNWTEDSFSVVKARNDSYLSFAGGYYLIFKDHSHACAFIAETYGESLCGMPFEAEFYNVEREGGRYLAHSILGESINVQRRKVNRESDKLKSGQGQGQNQLAGAKKEEEEEYFISVESVDPNVKMAMESTIAVNETNKEHQQDQDFLSNNKYTPEEQLFIELAVEKLPPIKRENCMVVYNLPRPLNRTGVIDHFLWDYDLYPDFSKAVQLLHNNETDMSHVWLVAFDNSEDPVRFLRRYHGKHLNNDVNHPKVFVEHLA